MESHVTRTSDLSESLSQHTTNGDLPKYKASSKLEQNMDVRTDGHIGYYASGDYENYFQQGGLFVYEIMTSFGISFG